MYANDGTVYRVACDVKRCDTFWTKGQEYSLIDLSFVPFVLFVVRTKFGSERSAPCRFLLGLRP